MTKHDFRHFDDDYYLARPTAVLQSQLCAIWLYSPSVSSSLRIFCQVYAKKEMNSQRFHNNTSLLPIWMIFVSIIGFALIIQQRDG